MVASPLSAVTKSRPREGVTVKPALALEVRMSRISSLVGDWMKTMAEERSRLSASVMV